MRKIRGFFLVFLCGIGSASYGQDIHFSQFFESPLTLNPALCGVFNGQIYAGINYRDQWASVMPTYGAAFNTMAATFMLHNIMKKWEKGYLSPGLSVYNDKSGDASIGITEINLTLASGIFLSDKSSLAAGIQAGWAQQSINLNGLSWDNQYINGQYNPNAPTGETSIGNSFSYVDFSAGLDYSYGVGQTNMTSNDQFKANFGAAVFHVNQPDMSYFGASGPGTKLYMRYVAHGYVDYGLPNTNIGLVPGFVYYNQGPANEFDLGMKIRYILREESKYTGYSKGSAFDVGAYYRWGDAAIVLTQLEFSNYAVGFSYDFNASALTPASSGKGGFELSLRFINPNPFMSSGTHSMF
ncbi:MAG: PorP/SprF family type IX secretion system membrane protein [Bacteroidia bacterium]